MENLLQVQDLYVNFPTPRGTVQAVRGVSFCLHPGEVLAIVGESGSGKSVLCKAIMQLLPGSAQVTAQKITAAGQELTQCTQGEMDRLRGSLFSMVFQDPLTSLNPTMTVGRQIAEAIGLHNRSLSRRQIAQRVLEQMELVGIDRAERRQNLYPHHFSGGMRQRIVLAIALAGNPRILFADEPTTALDVTIQAQILDLLRTLQRRLSTATVLVSHDLGVVARAADRVAVMYGGKIVEIGTAEEIFYDPRHPYTWGLLQSLPSRARADRPLPTIPGTPPVLIDPPAGDVFAPRNPYALEIDYQQEPPAFQVSPTHFAATWLLDPRAPKQTTGGWEHV